MVTQPSRLYSMPFREGHFYITLQDKNWIGEQTKSGVFVARRQGLGPEVILNAFLAKDIKQVSNCHGQVWMGHFKLMNVMF